MKENKNQKNLMMAEASGRGLPITRWMVEEQVVKISFLSCRYSGYIENLRPSFFRPNWIKIVQFSFHVFFFWISNLSDSGKNLSPLSWSQQLNTWLGWCHRGLSSRHTCFCIKGLQFSTFPQGTITINFICLCSTEGLYSPLFCNAPGKYYTEQIFHK